jgi:acetyltransferase-like isoleucine patch superfamily enzyme
MISKLWRFFAVHKKVKVGQQFHLGLGSKCWASNSLIIGDQVYIGRNCSIEVNGRIGNGVLIANNVGIVGRRDHDYHETGKYISEANWVGNHKYLETSVDIGDDVWIGFGAIILAPCKIGAGAIIGAGALISTDIPENSIVVGPDGSILRKRFSDEEWLVQKDFYEK